MEVVSRVVLPIEDEFLVLVEVEVAVGDDALIAIVALMYTCDRMYCILEKHT